MSQRSASSVPLSAGGARLRKRVDSPASQSGSSSDPGVELDGDLLAPLPLTYTYIAPPLVGPASTVVEDDLVEWRSKYSLSPHIALRAPASEERASIHALGEIPVYEAFFETGFRGAVPALIVGLCDFFEISPSQLNPPAWRILIAIQNLGDLEYGESPAPSFVVDASVRWRWSLCPGLCGLLQGIVLVGRTILADISRWTPRWIDMPA
ncbi:hypothetical protein Bca4012_065541 [Brassica carinata]